MENTKTNNIKLVTVIMVIIVFMLSSTYAFIQINKSTNVASGEGGCFAVNYTAQEINATNLVSTTDYTQGATSQVTLSKNAGCQIYTEASIYIHTNTDATTAPINDVQALKYKVLNSSNDVISGGIITTTTGEDLHLATVPLTNTPTTYTIYIWIDSSLSLGYYNSTVYSGYIYATSIQTSTIPTYVNEPNLDNGNLIPVYYDNAANQWKKADSTNKNNSWYDYENKRWANAIIVGNATKKATYQAAAAGTTITDSDITAFYVWIPRFKYRVWNINRQAGAETTYAYSAYTKGIEIEFERGIVSTGNVTCSYNIQATESATNLSDNCSVNGTEVYYNTNNSTYGDTNPAWYTHPAFNFDNNPKTGFWIGKFETTGTATAPTVLPDTLALSSQPVSEQFTTSKKFQNYLSSNVNAHMLTNLEWGAVAYLTHSIYGLCDETSCRDAYINNSTGVYTGRSAGVLAPSATTSTNGTYDYKGYTVGNSSIARDESKVASTTGNITGVYDMSGGRYEYVMGNLAANNGDPIISQAGTNWNGSTSLEKKYYNAYSMGDGYITQPGFNRAILGDATAEVNGPISSTSSAWQPGVGIVGANANFIWYSPDKHAWFLRGCGAEHTVAGTFCYGNFFGQSGYGYAFRQSIS